MHAIEENQRTLYDGTRITTYSREITSANVLEAEAGTTGYMGGDCELATMITALKFITQVLEEESKEVYD